MKKATIIGVIVIALLGAFVLFEFRSYPLQDGYRLQGFKGSHGQIYNGYFRKALDGDVNGVQGSQKGIIFGWVIGKPKNYFILHTQDGKVEWLDASDQAQKLASYGCPKPDMNKEVNLAGLRIDTRKFSRN
ncbi:MAG: hypothetical protein ACFE0O_12455 [Opitutales bacterium]